MNPARGGRPQVGRIRVGGQRDRDLRGNSWGHAEEARRSHADDGVGVRSDPHGPADDGRIGAVTPVPGRIADHGDPAFTATADPVVAVGEGAADRGGHAERRIVLARCGQDLRRFQLLAPRDVHVFDTPGAETLEDLGAARADLREDRIRERRAAEIDQPFRCRHRQIFQHQAVDQREDRGRRADAHRHHQHQRAHESRSAAEHPQRIRDVLPRAVHPRRDPGGPRLFTSQHDVAHHAAAGGPGIPQRFAVRAGTLLGHEAMGLDFFRHFGLELPLLQQVTDASQEGCHLSDPLTPASWPAPAPASRRGIYADSSTCWMAPISRWNSLRSAASRLRPAAVTV